MIVRLNYEGNKGYWADQVGTKLTLGDLQAQLEEAISLFGEDAEVVPYQTNNRGANYGSLSSYDIVFEGEDEEDQ